MEPLFDDFRTLVKRRRPLVDVRAPVEFKRGAFPGAVNLPLMNDKEREAVGICYKREGNEAAVRLGHELVNEAVRASRIEAWCRFVKDNPDALLYCFRGGQRSRIAQEWMVRAGCPIPRLKGGYKAFRRFLIEETERISERLSPLILAGRTGSGKTRLLKLIDRSIDLEALANHRGSAFGARLSPQPTQIDFENSVAYDLIEKSDRFGSALLFEDEGRNVGRLYLPRPLFLSLERAPLIVLQTPIEERVTNTWKEYVIEAQKSFEEAGADDSLTKWSEMIAAAMKRIERRLGGKRYATVRRMLDEASLSQRKSGSKQPHREWVRYLLENYYDPMYDYQIAKRGERVLFRGSFDEVAAYLKEALYR